jgi:hypothetical protein
VRFSPPSINKNNNLTEKRIANISLTEDPISTGPRNLESAQKSTLGENLRSMIRTSVRIPELDKKIRQIKKIEGSNQEKDRRNTTLIEMII